MALDSSAFNTQPIDSSLPSTTRYDLAAQQLKVQRLQMIAEMMAKNSQQPQGQMVSGHYVAPSWTQQLGAAGSQLGAGYYSGQAMNATSDMYRKRGQQLVQALADARRNPNQIQANENLALTDDAFKDISKAGLDRANDVLKSDKTDNKYAVATALGDSALSNPERVSLNNQLYEQRPDGTWTRSADARDKFDPNIGTIDTPTGPIAYQTDDTGKKSQFYNPQPTPIASAEAPRVMDDLAARRESTIGAMQTNAQADRVLTALQNPNVITGYGANLKTGAAGVAKAIGLPGSDSYGATKNLVAQMAGSALDAAPNLKGQGQISDNERLLLAQARAGTLELGKENIAQVAQTVKKIAAWQKQSDDQQRAQYAQDPSLVPLVKRYAPPSLESLQSTPDLTTAPAAPTPAVKPVKVGGYLVTPVN